MTRHYHSGFQPARVTDQGGTKKVWPYQHVEAIEGSAAHLCEQAEEIHTWLKEQGRPVEAIEVLKQFGTKTYNYLREKDTYNLEGYPLEELIHHGLARVVKGAR